MRRFFLSKRERKKLISALKALYNLSLGTEKVEVVTEGDIKLYLVDEMPAFIVESESLIPHLKYLMKHGHCFLPKIIIDRGAVVPVSRGADVMAPGILGVEGKFNKNSMVVVVEEEARAPVAVGRVLYSADEIDGIRRGRVVKNVHHYQDVYWKLSERV